MAKKALPTLTGGLNELTRNDLIGDSQLQISNNYEVIGDGTLKLRKASETYSDNLDTLLSGLYTDVTVMSEPYYPQKMLLAPTIYEPTEDFLLLFFGETAGGFYEMHMVFKYTNDNGEDDWNNYVTFGENLESNEFTLNDLLTSAGIVFTAESSIQFTIGQDRIVITDNVNDTFFVEIDVEGNVRVGKLGLPAPTNKAEVTPVHLISLPVDHSPTHFHSMLSSGLLLLC